MHYEEKKHMLTVCQELRDNTEGLWLKKGLLIIIFVLSLRKGNTSKTNRLQQIYKI